MKHTLLLVDGNALFYRAYHAFPKELTTPTGQPSGAAFGFTRILMAAVRNLKPTHMAVCFDVGKSTFRTEMFEGYKATRAAMPEDLISQVPMIWELVDRLEAPRYGIEGYEADDLIGTLATHVSTQYKDMEVIILTGDQDLLQLVSDRVSVYMPAMGFSKATMYTPEKVEEKYSFTPPQMIDYKALRGDTSDNIPGVPGIGEVTAKQLIAQFSSLDGLYQALDAGKTDGVKPAVLKKLQENEASARMSYTLATIRTDAPLEFDPEACLLRIEHPEKLVSLFNDYGFKSLITELPKSHKLVSEAASVFGGPDEVTPVEETESSRLDKKLMPILRDMEAYGVMVDCEYLKALEGEFKEEIGKLVTELHDLAGQPFNPDSPSQVGVILYDVLKIPTTYIRKGKSGFTTDAATLQGLAAEYPIASLLLKYREITKLQSTYIIPLQELVDKKNRIHTSYAPDTATGRISSRDPNLQNIPTKTEQGRRIRQAFIAPKGKLLLAADYSQIELRVAAHVSQDPVMLEAFASGKDFHTETATRMNVDRRIAKIINFSILYGKGAYSFSQDLGITMAEAKAYIDQYFETYAGLKRYIDELLAKAREDGFVTTMLGRKRMLPDLTSSNFQRRSAAEREAVNLPIQGAAAEILKQAMVNLAGAMEKEKCSAHMILTVHDELVLEIEKDELPGMAKLLREQMEHSVKLSVPLEVQVKSGTDWAHLDPYHAE
jgi:DNA polymerase I-like protein with 3'-5' exonuclease and polymerase domains/5'-3' exonuclease